MKIGLTGQRFGRLIVLHEVTKRAENGSIAWECYCNPELGGCGNTVVVGGGNLRSGNTKSCGCLLREKSSERASSHIAGKQFGRLKAVKIVKKIQGSGWGKDNCWLCECECGGTKIVRARELNNGRVRSCGCLKKDHCKRRALPTGQAARNVLYQGYKRSAERRGHVWEISDEVFDKLTRSNCSYCGRQPTQKKICKDGNGSYTYNGVDRVDNTKGYVLDNCVACCKQCNYAKGDLTAKEFTMWINGLVGYRLQEQICLN